MGDIRKELKKLEQQKRELLDHTKNADHLSGVAIQYQIECIQEKIDMLREMLEEEHAK